MDHPTQRQFCRQLVSWAEEVIHHGRSPFRRVEAFPSLLTAGGILSPPLVLWINRDSLMAAGVLLLPQRDPGPEDLNIGRHCAQALGLRHFATWAPAEVLFWEDLGGEVRSIRSLPLPGADSPAAFRELFSQVLEQFKILSVTGAVPPEKLSSTYLANLCLTARQEALPSLEEAFRIARGAERHPHLSAPPAVAALHQGTLTLLRLVTLLLFDRLPPTVHPEGLGNAMQFAIDALPPEIAPVLQSAEGEISLPPACAVRFHHLLRRLQQIRFGQDRNKAVQALEMLLKRDSRSLGGFSLDSDTPPPAGALLLNSAELAPAADLIEVAPAPLLAFTAILRHLRGLPRAQRQSADLFALIDLPAVHHLRAAFPASEPLTAESRRTLAIRLRLSWPNRRFSLPPRTPRWGWEFLHLLGLAAPSAGLEVETPAHWLSDPFGEILQEIFREQFTIERLARVGKRRVRIFLRKETQPDAMTVLEGISGRREIPWSQLREPSIPLEFSLDLPASLRRLLEAGTLHLKGGALAREEEHGLFLFSRSSVGTFLWRIAAGGDCSSPGGRSEVVRQKRFPRPKREILLHLFQLWPKNPPSQHLLDGALAPWFGEATGIPGITNSPRPPVRTRKHGRGEILQKLLDCAAAEGLRQFPEQYLYDYYRPVLREYHFVPPLARAEDFFDRTVFRDDLGTEIIVEGWETAMALQLSARIAPAPIALPEDRRLTATILDRYLTDLHRLRNLLSREAHRSLSDPAAAERLLEQAWEALRLPPWSMVEE